MCHMMPILTCKAGSSQKTEEERVEHVLVGGLRFIGPRSGVREDDGARRLVEVRVQPAHECHGQELDLM